MCLTPSFSQVNFKILEGKLLASHYLSVMCFVVPLEAASGPRRPHPSVCCFDISGWSCRQTALGKGEEVGEEPVRLSVYLCVHLFVCPSVPQSGHSFIRPPILLSGCSAITIILIIYLYFFSGVVAVNAQNTNVYRENLYFFLSS